jgi:hypothetical protein
MSDSSAPDRLTVDILTYLKIRERSLPFYYRESPQLSHRVSQNKD